MRPHFAKASAFTLIELLIAAAILSSLVLLLTALLSAINRVWVASEQRVSEFQDGRAILDLISRELSQAVMSPNLQFVHDPDLAGVSQRANSDCIFWQAPGPPTNSGNLSEIGYYLSDNYELKRFFVPPTDATNFQIFTSPNQPTDLAAPWVTNFITKANLSTTVSSGVLAFWARCLDRNGDSIPWLATAPPRFNSAAHFQPAIPGQTGAGSFKYTNAASTARANLLPSAIELVVVTLDPQTFKRNPSIPAVPAESGPDNLTAVRDSFNQQLLLSNIKTARTFSTRVNLVNSGQ
jgi:prepilin-type N-terminal cleavage/methylation domain-containing protein